MSHDGSRYDGRSATGAVARAVAHCAAGESVVVEEGPIEGAELALTASERRRLVGATPSRRREFTAGRYRAVTACARLGVVRPDLEPDARGVPAWPSSVVGSITHTDGWAAAAVAPSRLVRALGIDVEPASPLPTGVLDVVADARERRMLAALAGRVPDPDRVLFCVKEAVFKTWYPLTSIWLDFADAQVELRVDGSWSASGGSGESRFEWTGGWAVTPPDEGGRPALAAAALVLPAAGSTDHLVRRSTESARAGDRP